MPDGSVNPGRMTSFNHYALGAVADWLHRRVAGLAPGAPGYREIVVRPVPCPAVTSASARHDTPYGDAAVAWTRADGKLTVDVTVPVGVRASVHLPGRTEQVGHGRHSWTVDEPAAADEPITTVRDLIDSPALWAAATAVIVGHGLAADSADVARQSAAYLDAPAAELPLFLARKDPTGSGRQAHDELVKLLGG